MYCIVCVLVCVCVYVHVCVCVCARVCEVYKHAPSPVEHGEYRYAAELGERYEDFYVLTQLCEQLNDREKLRQYMTRFSEQVGCLISTSVH